MHVGRAPRLRSYRLLCNEYRCCGVAAPPQHAREPVRPHGRPASRVGRRGPLPPATPPPSPCEGNPQPSQMASSRDRCALHRRRKRSSPDFPVSPATASRFPQLAADLGLWPALPVSPLGFSSSASTQSRRRREALREEETPVSQHAAVNEELQEVDACRRTGHCKRYESHTSN